MRAVTADYANNLEKAVTSYEKALVQQTLAVCNGNKSSAAKLLDISRTTLRRKLNSYTDGGPADQQV
ncbi:hypothetical protein F6455_10045 [Proteobacteria bacterium 005FR1]|nr:hypothetical protein [Proteobacteria bacterium 005FR1]